MKALTIWQPWASLIMVGAKPNEFRSWDYRRRNPAVYCTRIAIHAGAREIKPAEVAMMIAELDAGRGSLIRTPALELLRKLFAAHKCRGVLPLGAVIGTAEIGHPFTVGRHDPDSDRIDQHKWAWPMLEPQPCEPMRCDGLQGFWNWSPPEGFKHGPASEVVPSRLPLR